MTYREFDLSTGAFVEGGFMLPKSKQDATWVDKDTLLVARDWGAGTTTAVGLCVRAEAGEARPAADAPRPRCIAARRPTRAATGADVLTDEKGNRLVVIQRRQDVLRRGQAGVDAGGHAAARRCPTGRSRRG